MTDSELNSSKHPPNNLNLVQIKSISNTYYKICDCITSLYVSKTLPQNLVYDMLQRPPESVPHHSTTALSDIKIPDRSITDLRAPPPPPRAQGHPYDTTFYNLPLAAVCSMVPLRETNLTASPAWFNTVQTQHAKDCVWYSKNTIHLKVCDDGVLLK
jgi:hypothetical protein